jgi:hypothetical protein
MKGRKKNIMKKKKLKLLNLPVNTNHVMYELEILVVYIKKYRSIGRGHTQAYGRGKLKR